MAIDVHAHYVPRGIVDRLRTEGARLGISVVEAEPGCAGLRFAYGLQVRPFFAKLVEEPAERIAGMATPASTARSFRRGRTSSATGFPPSKAPPGIGC